jgi:hypothetical protein
MHWEMKLWDDMEYAGSEELFGAFKDWIRKSADKCAAPAAPGPECFRSTPEHQDFATENAPGNFK